MTARGHIAEPSDGAPGRSAAALLLLDVVNDLEFPGGDRSARLKRLRR
jgi:hypothetical protein